MIAEGATGSGKWTHQLAARASRKLGLALPRTKLCSAYLQATDAVQAITPSLARICALGGRSRGCGGWGTRRGRGGCCSALPVPIHATDTVAAVDERRSLPQACPCHWIHIVPPLEAGRAWCGLNDRPTGRAETRLIVLRAHVRSQEVIMGSTVDAVLPPAALICRVPAGCP